jgi:hypothetical protein
MLGKIENALAKIAAENYTREETEELEAAHFSHIIRIYNDYGDFTNAKKTDLDAVEFHNEAEKFYEEKELPNDEEEELPNDDGDDEEFHEYAEPDEPRMKDERNDSKLHPGE